MRHNEEHLQEVCVRWFDLQYPQYRLLLHHSPNGGRRNVREAARFKKMGVRAGFPDLILLLPCHQYHYLAIELKTCVGRQSEHQSSMMMAMEEHGGMYVIVRSIEDFIGIVNKWVDNSKSEITT